jgi:release factor glutamine methyltransferase
VLGLKRIELYTQFGKAVPQEQLDELRGLVKRAGLHEPVAYLVGKTEFYSIEFEVTSDCLIPRPETEQLVQRAIEFLRKREAGQLACDLCTGCGIIAVAIAKNVPGAKVIATDISAPALAQATKNIEKHGLQERIELRQGDLFEPLVPSLDQFDLIASNPPYVSAAEYEALDKNVKDYEPRIALYAGEGGLDVYKRIAENVGPFLKPDGILLMEIGYMQGATVPKLLEETGVFASIEVEKDFEKHDRVVVARKASA